MNPMTANFSKMDAEERKFWRQIGRQIQKARRAIRPELNNYFGYDGRRKAMTQDDLAELVGLSRSSIANIEVGRQRMDVFMFTKIMKIVGKK